MPTDELKNILLEAMPPAGEESSQTLSDLIESLREVSRGVASVATEVSAQTGQVESLAQLAEAAGQPQTGQVESLAQLAGVAGQPQSGQVESLAQLAEVAGQPQSGQVESLVQLAAVADQPQSGQVESLAQLAGATGQPQSELVPLTSKAATRSSAGGGGGLIDQVVSTMGGSLLSAFPLFSEIASLFGGDDAAPPAVEKYIPPPAIDYEGAIQSSDPGVIYGTDYDATGMPRLEGRVSNFPVVPTEPASGAQAGAFGAGRTGMPTPITIQVQAMDSRSFLDHSAEIAQAVKEAILNSNSLNDVLGEL